MFFNQSKQLQSPSNQTEESLIHIIIGSQSKIKINAVTAAVEGAKDISIDTVKAKSLVPEQPIGDETFEGAKNRIKDARKLDPSGDIYIAIENGIFEEDDRKIDKALVLLCYKKNVDDKNYTYHQAYSEGVEFPLESFNKAKQVGFDKMTVGEMMKREGLVEKADDPHASLGKKIPRAKLIEDTLVKLGLKQICEELLSAKQLRLTSMTDDQRVTNDIPKPHLHL